MRNSLLDGYIAARAKSDFAALEVAGGLTACTKLGNGPNNRRVPDIMKGLGAIAEVEWTILQQSPRKSLVCEAAQGIGTAACFVLVEAGSDSGARSHVLRAFYGCK